MPIISKKLKKVLIIILSGAILVILTFTLVGLWHVESFDKVKGGWKVEQILLNNMVINDWFEPKVFSLKSDGRALLPRRKKHRGGFPLKYSNWRYQRKNLFQGQVIIDDAVQRFFDGTYEIEIIDHRRPQLMRLYSDSIEFYLREQYFSLENPTIEMNLTPTEK